jgi:hypothetical protein
MGCLSVVAVLEKVVDLLSPCVSPCSPWLDVQESADRLGPWARLVYGGGSLTSGSKTGT